MDERAPLKLKREVEPPQRTHNGMGVMVVACAAMFFAVAGSAFILRARMAHVEAVRAEARARAQRPNVVAPAARVDDSCGTYQSIQQADGTSLIVFRACGEQVNAGLPVQATVLPADLKLAVPPGL